MRKYIIFDLDGTLINSIPDMTREVNLFLSRHGGRNLTEREIISIIGLGARVLIKKALYLTHIKTTSDGFENLLSEWLEQYGKADMYLTKTWDGVIDTLSNLKQNGYKMAVCTNKPPLPTKVILDRLSLSQYFDVILDAESLPKKKPSPEPLWFAINKLGGHVEDAVMVGDSEVDAEAARNAGIPVILLSFGYVHVPFEEIKPDFLIESFSELTSVLEKL